MFSLCILVAPSFLSKPKKRRKLKVKIKKPKEKVVLEDLDYIEEETNDEGFVSKVVNFLAFVTGLGVANADDDSDISAKLDDFTIPAEVTMGLVGLYGLYFLAVSFDLSNRRKKRSLFQGSLNSYQSFQITKILYFSGLYQEENEVKDACQSQYESCLRLQNLPKIR